MSSKADQYRRHAQQALASAEQADCKIERTDLLKIAEVWFELAGKERDAVAANSSDQTRRYN